MKQFIPKLAAESRVDALGIDLNDNFPELSQNLVECKLSDVIHKLVVSFRTLTKLYDEGAIENYGAFDEVVKVIDSMFKCFGLTLERTQDENGTGLYIHVG